MKPSTEQVADINSRSPLIITRGTLNLNFGCTPPLKEWKILATAQSPILIGTREAYLDSANQLTKHNQLILFPKNHTPN